MSQPFYSQWDWICSRWYERILATPISLSNASNPDDWYAAMVELMSDRSPA